MSAQEITLSKEFKTQTTKAIISIIIFLLAYAVLFVMALVLTAISVYAGYLLIVNYPRFLTIALGTGLASLGFIVLFFLLNFLFKSSKVDRSHLQEIQAEDEPQLFKLIQEIVSKVDTDFPKRVYLSNEVNAAVFYDSSFWSMFLPVRKNLQIGLGLVNTVTKEELKAILAHEFGHFSQRTMKVGSYVYNVNHVIFNTLYGNDAYDRMVEKWAGVSGYFSIFALIAIKIVAGIQWILRQLYTLVNKSYLALSREMEFHADEIAASVTGYEPLKSSLLRLSLADHSYNEVLSFYNGKVSENLRSENIYSEQSYILNFLAEDSKIGTKHIFPDVSLNHLNKYDKSKLVIKDQWASHPGTAERIERLEKTNFLSKTNEILPANQLFANIERTQQELTNKIFHAVKYEKEARLNSIEQFRQDFHQELAENSFSKIYNSYYNSKNPEVFDLSDNHPFSENLSLEDLFSDDKTDLVYSAIALENDIATLQQISEKTLSVKSFDYDGKRYKKSESSSLCVKLHGELKKAKDEIKENDKQIFRFFNALDLSKNEVPKLKSFYEKYFAYDKEYEDRIYIYNMLTERMQFIHLTTPFDEIKSNFLSIAALEPRLKENILEIMENPFYEADITKEIRENFQIYLGRELCYFSRESYNDGNLEIFFTALNYYSYLLSRGFFLQKRAMLKYKEDLIVKV